MRPVRSFATGTLLAGGQHARKYRVKLLDRQILAHIAVCASSQSGVHFFFVITDSREDNDGNCRINFADEGDERDSIHFWHPKIDNDNFAVIVCKPGGCVKTVDQCLAGMSLLQQVSDKKSGDGGVVIDDKKLEGFAVQRRHGCYNYHFYYKH